jgi:hypothetical protein
MKFIFYYKLNSFFFSNLKIKYNFFFFFFFFLLSKFHTHELHHNNNNINLILDNKDIYLLQLLYGHKECLFKIHLLKKINKIFQIIHLIYLFYSFDY